MELLSTATKMLESMLIRVLHGIGSDGTYAHQGIVETWQATPPAGSHYSADGLHTIRVSPWKGN